MITQGRRQVIAHFLTSLYRIQMTVNHQPLFKSSIWPDNRGKPNMVLFISCYKIL